MRLLQLVSVVFAVGLWVAAPARADLQAGIAAFEAGNAEEALALLRPEAEAGNTRAQFLLGELLSGGAVPRDMAAATDWYRKAAEGGMAEAQFQLGMRYSVGLGLTQDLVQAYRWLRIADRSLETEAASQFIQSFVEKMSEAEISQAEALVGEWPSEEARLPDNAPAPTPDAPTNVIPAPGPPTRPTPEVVRDALRAHPCSDVQIVGLGTDSWQLEGIIQDGHDAQDLVAELAETLPGQRFENALQAVGRPVCAAAAVVARFRQPDQLTMTAAAGKAEYADGEIVAVDIALPPVSGYLYVDYYQLDGQVVHILPLAGDLPSQTEPDGQLRFGDGSTGLTLRVGPPFGREMLTAFVVPERLFPQPRETVEAAEIYLVDLAAQASRLAESGGEVLSDSLLITTAADR